MSSEAAGLAEVLGARKFEGVGHALAHGFRDMKVHCACGWESDDSYSGPAQSQRAFAEFATHQAEAVLAAGYSLAAPLDSDSEGDAVAEGVAAESDRAQARAAQRHAYYRELNAQNARGLAAGKRGQ